MPEVKIRIREREPMVNITYKVPPSLKEEIEKTADHHQVAQGEIVRAFLEYALDAYNKGRVTHVWGDDSPKMQKFRNELAIGDTIVASGNVGKITELEDFFIKMEIAQGIEIQTLREGVTDVISTKRKLRT